jgi:hypothetical protein
MLHPAQLTKPSRIAQRRQRAAQQAAVRLNTPQRSPGTGRQAMIQLDCATIPGSNLSAISG